MEVNGDITTIAADIRPGQIWIGGSDGFQLLNTTTGSEVYDIEKTGSLYTGKGDPTDLAVYGDTMYYHQQYSSDKRLQNRHCKLHNQTFARCGVNN